MRINNSNKPRKIIPSADSYLSCTLEDLPKNVLYILKNKNKIRKIIKKQKFSIFLTSKNHLIEFLIY